MFSVLKKILHAFKNPLEDWLALFAGIGFFLSILAAIALIFLPIEMAPYYSIPLAIYTGVIYTLSEKRSQTRINKD